MPVPFFTQEPVTPVAGSTYRLKLSVLRPSDRPTLNCVRPSGISMPLGRLAGASLRTSSVMRASLPGISLPSWLPATRVRSRVEATAICWLSLIPSPLPSPARPGEPSGRSRPGVCSSRSLDRPSRAECSASGAFGPYDASGAGGGGGSVGLGLGREAGRVFAGAGFLHRLRVVAGAGVVVGDAPLLAPGHGAVERQRDGLGRCIHDPTGDVVAHAIDQHHNRIVGRVMGLLRVQRGFIAVLQYQLPVVHRGADDGKNGGVYGVVVGCPGTTSPVALSLS